MRLTLQTRFKTVGFGAKEMDSNQPGTVKSWQVAFSRSKNIVRAWGATLLLIDGVENRIIHLKKKLCQQWEALKYK